MLLNVPADFDGAIMDAAGTICQPVNGVVDIPDGLLHAGLFARGLTQVPPAAQAAPEEKAAE